jgi:hypothetical protein
MANYEAFCRSNYFQVKDEDEFLKYIKTRNAVSSKHETKGFMVHSENENGWPSYLQPDKDDPEYNEDAPDGYVIDFFNEISSHLTDDSVAIFIEAGHEKLRYLCGYAVAINSMGDTQIVDLDDIYTKAKLLGSSITAATY